MGLTSLAKIRKQKMKVKWVELTEDDPMFRQGFIFSNIGSRQLEKQKSELKHKKSAPKKKSSKLSS